MKIRGRVTALVGPTITFGILSGYVVNFLLNGEVFGWRVSRALICVMGAVYIIALAFLPRSPRFVVLHRRVQGYLFLSLLKGNIFPLALL